MTVKAISKANFKDFVGNLLKKETVFGVKRKETKFAFGPIDEASDLVLDYDVTLQSPRAYFQPPKEKLFDFQIGERPTVTPSFETKPFVLVGVHTYDMRAINQMDVIWNETNADQHYRARREAATIIALEPTRASEWSFWSSLDSATNVKGFDLLLTDIGDKYAVEIGTKKGDALLTKYASAEDASPNDVKARDAARAKLATLCRAERKIGVKRERLADAVKKTHESPIWEKEAEKCYSCGSCNLVCPTCYCFDVKDNLELDIKNGQRSRNWDGCLLDAFAKVGSGENFREERTDRFRHRIFRKFVYVPQKLSGELACIGCGRCSSACLPDITDPVKLVNELTKCGL
jgi:ferredoxin